MILSKNHLENTVFTQVSGRGAHLILSFEMGALFRGRRSLNTSKRHQNTFNLSLESNNKNSNNNRRIECLTFKIVCKTPLFTKEKEHYNLNQLYYRIFLCTSQMSAPFKYYFSKECLFWEKRGALIRGRSSFKHRRFFE